MKNKIRILSIDPGTTVLGWAISEYTPLKDNLHIIKYSHFEPSYIAKKNKKDCLLYTQQIISLEIIEEAIENILNEYTPNFVVTEDAFIHPKRINAYVALRLCIHSITRICKFHGLSIYKLAPKDIKKIVTGTGCADKDDMINKVSSCENITYKKYKDMELSKMIEHEADAIAVGYAFVKKIYPDL